MATTDPHAEPVSPSRSEETKEPIAESPSPVEKHEADEAAPVKPSGPPQDGIVYITGVRFYLISLAYVYSRSIGPARR
jgi:hypothetical protein